MPAATIPPVWECRYVAETLPARFAHDTLVRTLGPRYRVLEHAQIETDDYLLTPEPTFNLKLRHRPNSVKLKSRQSVSSDRLECWGTDFDHQLPADARVWGEALRLIECSVTPEQISAAATAKAAADLLRPFLPPARFVRVDKVRSLYSDGQRRIEVAQFACCAGRFVTICLESQDADDVREVMKNLSAADLGHPRNYVEVLSEAYQ
jgi:hypothetical protein